jgi:hypothetical protein
MILEKQWKSNMEGHDLIRYIQSRPQLIDADIKYTIMALLNDRLINPSALIDAQLAIKDEECKKMRNVRSIGYIGKRVISQPIS